MQRCPSGCLQATWNTSQSWSHGDCWRCSSTSTSGPVKKPSASPTSCFPCWSWSLRREPQLQSACATHGSPSSGVFQPLHLPSLSLFLQRLQQITFQFGHIRWIFISLFVFFLFSYVLVELKLLCMFALYLLVLFSVWWRQESSGLYFFVMLAPTAVLCSPFHPSKPVIVLLVTHPCLFHSCTKSQKQTKDM